MNLRWDENYPDREGLRKETKYMIDAYLSVLYQEIPKEKIEGLYLKGSAQKEWQSPIDYVPELSDIDIHLLFKDSSSIEKYLGSLEQALTIQAHAESNFHSKVTEPTHIPRPQLMILNTLLKEADFFPSPRSAISVLYGKEYPEADFSNVRKIRYHDCEKIIERGQVLAELPVQIADKPSKYLYSALRQLSWRVSPIGPSVINILGIDPELAWSINRTRIVNQLAELDQAQLAQDYAQFYLNGWDYFLSGYRDGKSGRSALISGAKVIERGVRIAQSLIPRYRCFDH